MKPEKKPARGFESQRTRREWERDVKIDALAFTRWISRHGLTRTEAAERLHVNAHTLAGWEKGWRSNRLALKPRGRTLKQTDRITRECILAVYYLAGPGIGLPTLRGLFPTAPKCDLQEMLQRLRASDLHKGGYMLKALRWWSAGSVWAVDHLDAPQPVDGIYPYVLAVRDLSSGFQLMALPVKTKEADEVVAAMQALFIEHGAPLVLKSDQGFKAQVIIELLLKHRVQHLLSPAYYPKYNGSIEAGIGSLKTRIHHEAARHEHPGEWNCDDVEAGRLQANELARPWGHKAECPLEAWMQRNRLRDEDRNALEAEIQKVEPEVRQELGLLPLLEGSNREEEAVKRICIVRALIQRGFLSIRRRSFTPPIKRSLWARIS